MPGGGWQAEVRNSIKYYLEGDLLKAFLHIDEVDKDIQDPRFFNYRATLLLSVGRVDEAIGDIEKALTLAPGNGYALALQSIIAVVQNEKDRALDLAREAVKAAPDSAAARIALSYAQQADFELEDALDSIKKAVELEPDNSLAWARLAELRLSFGDIDKSLEAAKKAVQLNPGTARAQSVLGFAYLSQIRLKESVKAFEKAIELDQVAPLPRLGLGLAKIRKGDLIEGRKEIEIAVSLDPDNSIIRSYLGKALYEEKRDKKATEELATAKELDPSDPTSFFYDAIRKQSLNRPVEALHDLQKSIELNDNRAVYRSRLLLDDDLAARSASLARIYDDLGFQQLALSEGWKSVATDPGSHSAHRFLADSYSVLPRHEVARVSELLQSQLLQPINITPVQPHLAENNLNILDGAGPGDLSFNEFNPMFNRNKFSAQGSLIYGDNNTRGDEVVLSAVIDNFSISSGQYHYDTDGFRRNNDLNQDFYNFFTQARITHDTSVMAEFRATDVEKGDVTLNFNTEDDVLPNKREESEDKSMRFGLRHSLTSKSDIIATVVYKDSDDRLNDITEDNDVSSIVASLGPPFTAFCPSPTLSDTTTVLSDDDDGYTAEIQHQFRSERFNIISGAGLFSGDNRNVIDLTIPILCPPLPLLNLEATSVDETYLQHINFYVYSNITYPKNMTWTIGASSDFFEGGVIDQTDGDPNPKLGLTWTVLPDTTLRAAVFRVLKRTLITDQTIEPTQVAGFNQFFDDTNGTESWRYGIALDQKFTDNLYGGLEFSKRDLEVSVIRLSEAIQLDRKEQVGRFYIYWTPHRWLALSVEYEYERFDRDQESVQFIEEVKTHSFPLGISFYHPSGLSARLKLTYIDQKGSFQTQRHVAGTFFQGSDRFWIADASVSYRLPKRFGLITIGAKNLFDKSFSFQDTDPVSPVMQPERLVFFKVILAI